MGLSRIRFHGKVAAETVFGDRLVMYQHMTHHFCAACGGVAETPGTCQTSGCSAMGQELAACDCEAPEMHKKDGGMGGDSAGT